MQTITITVQDDGRITVEGSEFAEPYECDSAAECAQFIESVLTEESGESPAEQQGEGKEDYAAAWDEEAQARKPQPGLMA